MIDLSTDEGMRAAFKEIAAWQPEPAVGSVAPLVVARGGQRSRRSVLLAVAASVVLLAVVAAALLVGRARRLDIPAASGTWTVMAPSLLSPRLNPAVVWDGDEMLVWGGTTQQGTALTDGAAYSPATNTWRPISDAPAARDATILDGRSTVGAWTGTAVVAVQRSGTGLFDWDLVTYRPDADTWTTVEQNRYEQLSTDALEPTSGGAPLDVPTAIVGRRGVAVVFGWNSREQRSGWTTFDPTDGSWSAFRPVNDNYITGGNGSWALVDDRWLVLAEAGGAQDPDLGVTVVDLQTEGSYHLTYPEGLNGVRASTPRIDSSGLVVGAVVRPTDDPFDETVDPVAAVIDPAARTWRLVTPPPGPCDPNNDVVNHPEMVALPDGVATIGCVNGRVAAVSDASVAHWASLDGVPIRVDRAMQTMIWTGRELIVWGGAVADPGGSINQPAVPLSDGAVMRYDPSPRRG